MFHQALLFGLLTVLVCCLAQQQHLRTKDVPPKRSPEPLVRSLSWGKRTTQVPSAFPTFSPTSEPTLNPTSHRPTIQWETWVVFQPTPLPTTFPTIKPSPAPTVTPTFRPSAIPTLAPSKPPTLAPTVPPSLQPTPTSSPTTTDVASLSQRDGLVTGSAAQNQPGWVKVCAVLAVLTLLSIAIVTISYLLLVRRASAATAADASGGGAAGLRQKKNSKENYTNESLPLTQLSSLSVRGDAVVLSSLHSLLHDEVEPV